MNVTDLHTDFAPPAAIYDSREDLDAYLTEVRERRENRRRAREKRGYWNYAVQQVEAELALAQEDGDAQIVAELCSVLTEFERLLSLAPGSMSPADEPQVSRSTPPAPIAGKAQDAAAERIEPREPELPSGVAGDSQKTPSAPALDPVTLHSPGHAVVASPLPVEEPEESVEDAAERERRLEAFRAEIDAVAAKWGELNAEGLLNKNGALDRALCFRLRGLACSLNAIHARAFDALLEQPLLPELRAVRNAMVALREYSNDRGSSLPFDDDSWATGTLNVTAEEWEELAGRYERMNPAMEAWAWVEENRHLAPQTALVRVLNGVAAAQRALYCTLDDFGGRDRLQVEMHTALVDAAKQTAYLTSLSADADFSDLVSQAAALETTLAAAQRETTEFQARKAKDARKAAALTEFERLFAEQPALGAVAENLSRDREALFPILDECLAAGIPPTYPQIRNALVENGPQLLEGELKYSRFLDAVLAERQRQGLQAQHAAVEAEPEEEPSDAVIHAYKEVVRLFTADQRILILGGTRRQRVPDELKEALDCADVEWIESKKSDKASRFQAEIKKSNILIVVKNYAGHDMSEKGKEWIKSVGGHFILLPSGYGVNQIIHQLYKYVASRPANP